MVYSAENENAIYLWWDNRKEFVEGCLYQIIMDKTTCVYSSDRLYDFENLDMSVLHDFEISVVDKDGKIISETEYYTNRLVFENKEIIDVTKKPYYILGDGKTISTEKLQKVFNKNNTCVYFPSGVYLSDKIEFSGNLKIVFNSGATIKNINGDK